MTKYNNLSKEDLLKLVEKQEKELKFKKYGLVWDSEREPEQVVLDCANNLPVLKRVKGKEIKTDDSEDNILIEGDNYHALTVLNYTHKEKIDVIYIDPPYNMGKANEWKYNDKYVDENDGYRHSKWLNFMEKRLNLVKKLLKHTGVIFISINDYEGSQLKILCDKIFGEENFLSKLVWENKEGGGGSDSAFFRVKHEYILCYSKNINAVIINGESQEENSSYNYKDKYYKIRGKYKLIKLNSFSIQYSDSLNYKIKLPNGKYIEPSEDGKKGCWRWSKEKLKWGIENNFIEFKKNDNGQLWVYTKQYYKVDNKNHPIKRLLPYRAVISQYSSTLATKQLEKIFGRKPFNYPKPYELINFLISLYPFKNKEGIVLDFFAGSGTTGHAVLELNKEDDGNRKFILCTNNEELGSNGDVKKHRICTDITYPRIYNVIKGHPFKGKDKTVLLEKRLTFSQFKNIEDILKEINDIIEKNKDKYDKIEKEYKDNTLKIIGVKEIDGKKDGLGSNLQYFKTSLIKKTKNQDQVKVNLTRKCTEMLCVKENIFNLEKKKDGYKIFSSNKKNKFLCVYYNFLDDSFDEFLKEIKKLKSKKIIYMFSVDNKVDKSLFVSVDNFTIEAIPQKILDVYKQLVKMNIPIKTNVIFLELSKAKVEIFNEEEKDAGARRLRIVLEKLIQKVAQNNGINILNSKGKEEKISTLNDKLKHDKIFTHIEWEENRTYLAIGNHASHGDHDEYNMEQVKNFYKHIQSLLNNFNIQ